MKSSIFLLFILPGFSLSSSSSWSSWSRSSEAKVEAMVTRLLGKLFLLLLLPALYLGQKVGIIIFIIIVKYVIFKCWQRIVRMGGGSDSSDMLTITVYNFLWDGEGGWMGPQNWLTNMSTAPPPKIIVIVHQGWIIQGEHPSEVGHWEAGQNE